MGLWHAKQLGIDSAGLARLDLPRDAATLVAHRITVLDAENRRLLGVGAVLGNRFDPDLVAAVGSVHRQRVADALADAVWQRLMEATGDGSYRFLHHGIREVLLDLFDPAHLRALHDRAAAQAVTFLERAAETAAAAG